MKNSVLVRVTGGGHTHDFRVQEGELLNVAIPKEQPKEPQPTGTWGSFQYRMNYGGQLESRMGEGPWSPVGAFSRVSMSHDPEYFRMLAQLIEDHRAWWRSK